MRYSVAYEGSTQKWSVIDKANGSQVVGLHTTRDAAFHQAFVEQERWRKLDPVAQHLSGLCNVLPRSLVVG